MIDEFKLARKLLRIATRIVNSRSRDVEEFFESNEGSSASDLKDYLEVSHQAARSLVDRMKQKNLLSLVVSPADARAKAVYLTDNGRTVFARINQFGKHAGHMMLNNFTEDEKFLFSTLLDKIDENVDLWQS